ncbi:MAG TPA: hypothetical protein VF698_15605, partial [Thermoanaerobaculia bacterium]
MKRFLAVLVLLVVAIPAAGQVTVKMTADNYFAFYSGTPTAATTMHFAGAWPGISAPAPFAAAPMLYVAAWDDGKVYQGLLGSVAFGTGFVTTGSPLWQVCKANQSLPAGTGGAPNLTAMSAAIVACNSSNSWHAPSVGPNNGNSPAAGLWGVVGAIDPTAGWIWDTDGTPACAGTNGFLKGPCNPGEYLIFRIALKDVEACREPVPDFVFDWTAGYGTFVANGTSSQNETNYFWSVQESDASWNRIGPEITQWFPGTAGTFDLKTFY